MRFETSQSTPAYSDRRLQLRMLSFVAMIGVLMFFGSVVFTDPPKKSDATANRTRSSPRDIDDNVGHEEQRPLGPGEVFIVPPDQTLPERFEAPIERSREWLDEQAGQGEEWAADAAARGRSEARRRTRFNKRVLFSVRDNTVGIRRNETEAYYRLLNHVQRVAPDDLELASTTETQHINLMTDPDRFRGEPLTIQGDLWRLYEFEAGPNDVGLTTLYEAWIFTGDSQPHPFRVVCTHLPHTLTPGENIRKSVRVTGYFFKCEAYPSRGGFHVAPTLLANTITTYRLANSIPPTDAIVPYMVGVVTAIGLALLVTLLAFTLGDRRVKRIARQRALNAPSPSFAGIDTGPIVTVEESLRQFTEQQRQADLREEIAATGRDAGSVATSVLYRRDPYANVPPPVPVSTLSDDELHSRQLSQAGTLQTWTSRQKAADKNSHDAVLNGAALRREQRETERVLGTLDPEQATDGDETNSPSAATSESVEFSRTNSSTTISSIDAHERSARLAVERDRLSREQELHERLQRQQSELETERQEQLERDRETRARSEWNASRAEADRERIRLEREHSRPDSERREQERLERERFEPERMERARLLREEQERQQQELQRQERLNREREREAQDREALLRVERDRSRTEADRERVETERTETRSVRRESSLRADAASEGTTLDETSVDEPSLTEEQREEHRQRGTRRGGWGWPRRGQTSQRDAESLHVEPMASEPLHPEPLHPEPVADDLTDDEPADDTTADGKATTDATADDGTATPKKKSGWAAYNEQNARSKRRRRKDSR